MTTRPATQPDGAADYPLKPRAFMRAFMREPLAFWLLCGAFMIEYVRPQNVWPVIDFLPWGMASLVLAFIAFVFRSQELHRRFTMIDGLLIAFTVILTLSSFTSQYMSWSIKGWEFFINWLLIFVLVAGLVTNPKRYFIFLVLYLLWNLKMSQHATRTFAERGFSFANWGATGAPGWFHNSGEFAIQMCIFLPMSYYFMVAIRDRIKPWMFWLGLAAMPGTAMIGLIASSSRGGQLGGAVVIMYLIFQSRHRVRGMIAATVVIGGMWLFMPDEQKARFSEMGDDSTSQSRLTYWRHGIEIMNDYPLLGIGYESWEPYYQRHYNQNGELPHNIFVEAGSELGYSGLIAFVALIGATLIVNRQTRRLSAKVNGSGRFLHFSALGLDGALLGYLTSGFFVTVLYYPYFWVNLGFTAALYETTRRAAARQAVHGRVESRPAVRSVRGGALARH